MKLSKKDELLALGSALYLVGIEMEAHRDKLKELTADGEIQPTPELIEHLNAFNRAKDKFNRLEKRYLELQKEL